MPTWILAAAIALTAAAVMASAFYLRRSNPSWRRALPGVIASVAAIATFLGAYLWIFDTEACTGKADVACVLNNNDGSLTFLALGFAGVGLWIAALTRWADQRIQRATELETTRQALIAATDEATHNLVHCGSCWDDDGWRGGMPQLTISAIPLLLDPEHRRHLHPLVAHQADAVVRNWDALKDIPTGWAAGRPKTPGPHKPPNRFHDFLSRSIVLLSSSIRFHPEWCSERLMGERRLERLRQAAREKRRIRFTTLTSEIADEGPDLRVNDTPVLCWWNDSPIDDVTVYAVGPMFKDLAEGHRH